MHVLCEEGLLALRPELALVNGLFVALSIVVVILGGLLAATP